MYVTACNSIINSVSTAFYIHFPRSTLSFPFVLFFYILSLSTILSARGWRIKSELVNIEKRKNTCENEIGFDKEKQGEMGKDEEKSRPLYNTLTHPFCISYQARLRKRVYTHIPLAQYFRNDGGRAE